jgi:hypothetical protein
MISYLCGIRKGETDGAQTNNLLLSHNPNNPYCR